MRATIWGVTRWSGGVPAAPLSVAASGWPAGGLSNPETGTRLFLSPPRKHTPPHPMAPELTRGDFVLHSVQSHDLDNTSRQVELTAELRRHGRDDLTLEAVVSRLSLEPAVSSPGPSPNPNQPS